MHVYIKNQGTEKTLIEIARFFETHYPAYYAKCVREMKELKAVSRTGYTDSKGNYTHVSMKVPTVLFMACQHVMPGFGDDSDDIALLTRVLRDLDGHVESKRSQLLVPSFVKKQG